MKKENIINSIYYIVERAEVESISLGKTKLIKLLYLLDIENYRLKKEAYTDIEWIYFKFGPFSFELDDLLQEIDILEEPIITKNNKFFANLKIEQDEKEIKLEIAVKALIEKLLMRWGTADINELLDYVYFDTEPMQNAKFKDKLNFSVIRPKEREKKIEVTPEIKKTLKEICGNIKNRLDQIEIEVNPLIRQTPDAKKHPLIWDDEIKDLSFLKGKIKLDK